MWLVNRLHAMLPISSDGVALGPVTAAQSDLVSEKVSHDLVLSSTERKGYSLAPTMARTQK